MNLLRTMLFLPGNNPGMVQNGGVFGADAVILDLEDAVSPKEKDAARHLVSNALRQVDFKTSMKVVRTNPIEYQGEEDLRHIVPAKPDALLLPKINSAAELQEVVGLIEQLAHYDETPIGVIPLIETAAGVVNVEKIAQSSNRIIAIAFGAEDYTVSIGTERTKEGLEILNARSRIVNAAAAAGLDAIDTPFTDVTDEDGLTQDVEFAKRLGFKGKLVINPRQIDRIHNLYTPTLREIRWAQRVVEVIEEANRSGSGVISLDGKMVDQPIVMRARRTLEIAGFLHLAAGEAQ